MIDSLVDKTKVHKKSIAIFMVLTLIFQMLSMMLTPIKADAASKKTLKETVYQPKILAKGVTPNGNKYPRLTEYAEQVSHTIDGRDVFCIEMGQPTHDGAKYNVTEAERFKGDFGKSSLDELSKIVYHGYTKRVSTTDSQTIKNHFKSATTLMIWEAMGGKITDTTAMNTPWLEETFGGYTGYKELVQKEVKNHGKVPSFHNKQIKLNVGESVTLTDENGVFKDFRKSQNTNDSLKVKRDGNKITITATENSKTGKIRFQKYSDEFTVKDKGPSLVYHEPGLQTLGEFYLPDPVYSVINIEVIKNGSIEIFKKGNDTDKGLAGAKYDIYDGDQKITTVTTDSQGKAKVDKLTHGKTYTIKEVKAPHGYTVDTKAVNVKVEAGKNKAVTFTNKAVLGQINVTKEDSETGKTAQGDAKLGNEKVQVLDSKGNVVDEGEIPAGDKWTSKKLPLGEYTVVETKAGKGYNLQKEQYPVTLSYKDQNTAVVKDKVKVTNDVIKGKVEIEKYSHSNEGGSGFLSALPGAEFTFTLKSTGKVYDKVTTDKNGHAITKDLPFGTYIVKETKTPKGYIPIGDFEVEIKDHGKVKNYKIVDGDFKKFVKIIKQDEETKKPIAIAGTTFKVKDMKTGEFITQKINYPTPMELDEFETNEEGYLVLPTELKYGQYELHEVKAPEGYVLSEDPIPFEVSEETMVGDTVTVAFGNFPQLGKATILKTGDSISKAVEEETEFGLMYNLEFEQRELEGATFNVIAREDIVTNDGTVRAKAGEVVDTIVTNEEGLATTTTLHLGKYEMVEVDAPEGYVVDKTPIPFELEYAGQDVEVTSNDGITAVNHLQNLVVHTHKVDEQVVEWKDGKAVTDFIPSNDKMFGLFTRDAITLDEENIVPENTLVGYAQTTDGVAEITGKYPAGKYYIKELPYLDSHVVTDKEFDIELSFENNNPVYEVFVWDNGVEYSKESDVDKTDDEAEEVSEETTQENKEKVVEVKEEESEVVESEDNAPEVEEKEATEESEAIKETEVTEEETTEESEVAEEVEATEDETTATEESNEESDVTEESEVVEEEDTCNCDDKTDDKSELKPIVNKLVRGDLEITKTDVSEGKPLSNAKFQIKNDKGEVIRKGETDKNGIAYFEDLPYGKYTYQEYDAPEGYIVDESEFPFEIKEDGEVVKAKMTNEAIEGDLEITKTDVASGEALPNAKFEIKNDKGKVIRKGETDKNGIAYFEDLPYGKYTYREYEAPEGYIVDDSDYPFEIKEDGEIVKAHMTNKKKEVAKPEQPKPKQSQVKIEEKPEETVVGKMLPNTATEMFNMLLAGVLMLAVAGGAIYFMKKRKKSTDIGEVDDEQ